MRDQDDHARRLSAALSSPPASGTGVAEPGRRAGRPTEPVGLRPDHVLDGRYQLGALVSGRGRVELWRGIDLVLARPVAIRVLVSDGSDAAEAESARLIAAAVRSGRLVHSGAASTYDATRTAVDGTSVAYVVSEWVAGTPLLQQLMDEGPLEPDRAVTVVEAVAEVLAAAHARGVTHGDLHPGDVVVTAHGMVKVLDLEVRSALAEVTEDPAGGPGGAPVGSGAAGAGVAADDAAGRDVEALGALLYAALTARWPLGRSRGLPAAPLDGEGRVRTPRQVRAGVPREVDAVVTRVLGGRVAASSPGTRLATARAVSDALAALPVGRRPPEIVEPAPQLARPGPPMPPPRERRKRRLVPVLLLLALALAAWVLGVSMGRLPGSSTTPPAIGADARPALGPPLTLAAVRDFDPQSDDGREQPDLVPLAHDGDPGTAWPTATYRTYSDFGRLKSGVGLLIDLGTPQAVREVQVVFLRPGASVELRAADVEGAGPQDYRVLDTAPSAGADVRLTPADLTAHRYWLVWLTGLPEVDPGSFRAEIAEIAFRP